MKLSYYPDTDSLYIDLLKTSRASVLLNPHGLNALTSERPELSARRTRILSLQDLVLHGV